MRRGPVRLAFASLVITGAGCANVLGIGDLDFEGGSAGGGAADGGGGSAMGGMGGAGTGTGAGGQGAAGGGGGMVGPPAPGLEIVGSRQTFEIDFQTPGRFRLAFTKQKQWQLDDWYDLASDPNQALGATGAGTSEFLFDAFDHNYESQWYGGDQALSGDIVELIDETPVRVIFRTTTEPAPAGAGFGLSADYTVWANGRIGTLTEFSYTGASPALVALEPNHCTVSNDVAWMYQEAVDGVAAMAFIRSDGPDPKPNILHVHHGPETNVGQDNPTNHYWSAGTLTFDPNDVFSRTSEMLVAPGGLTVEDLAARSVDIRNPGTPQLVGATPMGDGYDEARAAYQVQATGTAVEITLDSTHSRYEPRFEVHGFDADGWSISLDGELLATSDQPSGPKLHARMTSDYLVFVYLEDIPDGQQPTFVISGN